MTVLDRYIIRGLAGGWGQSNIIMHNWDMTVSLPYAVSQILILDRFGFSKADSFAILDIKPDNYTNPLERLPIEAFNRLFAKAAKALNDPYIALKVGNQFRIGGFQETGKVYSFCKNLTEVLEFNARYQPIAVDIAKITSVTTTDSDTNKKRYFVDFEPYSSNEDVIEHVLSLVIGAYVTTFRWITWNSARDIQGVYLQLPKPEDDRLHKELFQCPVHFNQPFNRIEFHEDSMRDTISTHDPVRKAQCVAILEAILDSDAASASFKEALGATVRQGVQTGQYSLPLIADKLNISEGRLKKQLKNENIKYRDFLEEVRKDLFIEKHNSGMSFTQIALDLGYNDQAAFTKAFKRWHGMSPTAFKQQNIANSLIKS